LNSVIITDYGGALGETGDRLVVRGARRRLESIEGGLRPVIRPCTNVRAAVYLD